MQDEKRNIPLLFYYLLTSSITSLVFVIIGVAGYVLLTSRFKLNTILIVVVFFVLLQKSLIVGYVTYSAHKQARFDKFSGTKFIGFYYGRFFGFIIGVFIGSVLAGGIGAVIGGVTLYIAGRWIGSRVGFFIGHFLDRNIPFSDVQGKIVPKISPSKRLFGTIYLGILPFVIFLLAIYFQRTRIEFSGFPEDWLPTSRVIVLILSLYSLSAPWFILKRVQSNQLLIPSYNVSLLGAIFPIVPVLGFILFTMGASIIELGGYSLISSLAVIIWRIKTRDFTE